MRTTIDLNSEDIRAIIALHFGVKIDAVKVFVDTVYPYEPGEDSYEVAKATVVQKTEIALPPSLICKKE